MNVSVREVLYDMGETKTLLRTQGEPLDTSAIP